MKKIAFSSLMFFFYLVTNAQTSTDAVVNIPERDAFITFQTADKELNSLCQQIIKSHAADTSFVRSFRTAQKVWIQLRDAELHMLYPEVDKNLRVVTPAICWSNVMTAITKDRTARLTAWLIESKEFPCLETQEIVK